MVLPPPVIAYACLGEEASGGLVVHDGCLSFTAPGPAAWSINGGVCTIDGAAQVLPADEFLFSVVAATDVEGRTFLAPERLALLARGLDSYTTTGAPLPEDLGLGRDVAVAGARLPIDVELVRRADGAHVAYDGHVRVAADPRGDGARLEAAVPGGAKRVLAVDEGAHAALLVDTVDGPLRAGVVRVVGAADVAALEVTVFWTTRDEDRTPAIPIGALALVWLADGTRADAAPVAWSIVDGELEMGDPVAGLDFIFGAPAPNSVADSPWLLLRPTEAQSDAPAAYTATLRATLGAFSVDVPLSYGRDLTPPAEPPPPAPAPACGCGQAKPNTPAPVLLLASLIWLGRCARQRPDRCRARSGRNGNMMLRSIMSIGIMLT